MNPLLWFMIILTFCYSISNLHVKWSIPKGFNTMSICDKQIFSVMCFICTIRFSFTYYCRQYAVTHFSTHSHILQEVQDDVVIGIIATRDCQNVVDTLLSHVTSAPPPHNNFKSAAAPLSHGSVAHLKSTVSLPSPFLDHKMSNCSSLSNPATYHDK